jgi:hypothetical protein
MRDVTPPTVTCDAPPVFDLFQIGVSVPASVADATSGPLPAVARGVAITSKAGSFMSSVTGTDAAGNRTTQTLSVLGCRPDVPWARADARRHGR